MKKLSTVIMLICFCFTLVGCAQSGGTQTASTSGTPKTTLLPSPSQSKNEYKVGDTVTLGQWEITISSFEFSKKIKGDYGSFTPDDGNVYIVVNATVKNSGKTADKFIPSITVGNKDIAVEILYDNSYEFTSVQLLGYDKDLHNKSLNPLSSASGIIAFSVAEEVSSSGKPILLKFTLDNKEISFVIR